MFRTAARTLPTGYLLLVCLVCFNLAVSRAASVDEPYRVLLLFSNNRLLPANMLIDTGFRAELAPQLDSGAIELHTVYLDAIRFPEPEDAAEMAQFLEARHGDTPPDAIVTIGPQAYDFVYERRDRLFAEAAWFAGGSTAPSLESTGIPADVMARPLSLELTPLFQHLPDWLPNLRRLIVVTGASAFDRRWEDQAREETGALPDGVEVEYWSGLPLGELLERAGDLDSRDAILYLTYFQDPSGQAWFPREVASLLAENATVPVFGPYDTYIGTGVTGGAVTRFEAVGADMARLVLQQRDESTSLGRGLLPPLSESFLFDYHQLQRWRIDEGALPPDSEVMFRPPSIWEAHRTSVLTAGGFIVLQSILIAGLILAGVRQQRVQNALRQSERRFAGIFRGSPNATSLVRQEDGRILDVNREWEQLTGYPRDHAVGRTPVELQLLPDTSHETLFEFLSSERRLRGFELLLRTRTGERRWISLSCEPVRLLEERCYIVMSKDITNERELANARDQLLRSSRLASLGELSATIAHEINQPLAAILSNTDALEMVLEAEPNPDMDELREIVADIRRENLRASQVIRKVRDLLRQQPPEYQAVPVDTLIGDNLQLLEVEALRRGVDLRAEIPEGLPPLRMDVLQIEQVLTNLALNAMEAMETVPIEKRRIVITAHLLEGEEQCEIMVRDTGPGIPVDRLPEIFTSLFTTKPTGMGLGLALCHSIIEAHGGRISAGNVPEGGALFCFTLPVYQAS